MSNLPISSLPIAIALTGSEEVPLVQAGTTKSATVTLINASNVANIPAGGLTGQGLVKQSNTNYDTIWNTVSGFGTVQEVDTGTGLTGGPITLTGTVSLAPITSHTVLANITGGSAAPIPNTPTSILDLIGATQGDILYRNASNWTVLAPGSNGQILTSGGPSANPAWSAVGSGTVTSVGLSLPGIFTVSGSPVTTTGTLTGSLNTQSANLVWAGPTTGAASAPTFRSLVGADLPNPSASSLGGIQSTTGTAHQWLSSISTSGVPGLSQPSFTDISGTASAAQLPNPGPSSLGGIESFAAVSHQWINQISTSGVPSATQPGFGDISGNTSLSQLPVIGSNAILSNVTGGSATPLGNSLTSLIDTIGSTHGDILYRNASSWVVLAPGSSGQVLQTAGAAANPSWQTVSGTGTVTSVATNNGLTGGPVTSSGTIGLASIATGNVLAYTGAGSGVPVATAPTAVLDVIGSTEGDVLYRGASTWSALAPGTSGQFLQTAGAGSTPTWAAIGAGNGISVSAGTVTNTGVVTVKKQVFTSSGTYTPSTGMIYAMIECQGPGGGGGGIANSSAGAAGSAGGGGAGSYSRTLVTAAAVGASKTVTVGTGGGGGANTGANGSNGSAATSVGTLCIANAGSGGVGGQFGVGGAGGTAATGDITVPGNNGGGGTLATTVTVGIITGHGGASFFGGSPGQVVGASVSIIGASAGNYGSGGNGGLTWNGGGAVAGGAGGPGIVYITEYCSQ